jgi:hypothetical protein
MLMAMADFSGIMKTTGAIFLTCHKLLVQSTLIFNISPNKQTAIWK